MGTVMGRLEKRMDRAGRILEWIESALEDVELQSGYDKVLTLHRALSLAEGLTGILECEHADMRKELGYDD